MEVSRDFLHVSQRVMPFTQLLLVVKKEKLPLNFVGVSDWGIEMSRKPSVCTSYPPTMHLHGERITSKSNWIVIVEDIVKYVVVVSTVLEDDYRYWSH